MLFITTCETTREYDSELEEFDSEAEGTTDGGQWVEFGQLGRMLKNCDHLSQSRPRGVHCWAYNHEQDIQTETSIHLAAGNNARAGHFWVKALETAFKNRQG